MKYSILLLVTLFLVVSCSDDDDTNVVAESGLIGDWKLIEVYLDPGDGSGNFEAVDSEKTVTFLADGSISSNGNLCHMAVATTISSTGTYSLIDGSITIPSCDDTIYNTSFEMIGQNVIISYLCIEGCQEKYLKRD